MSMLFVRQVTYLKRILNLIIEFLIIYLIGAILYSTVEIIWRGYTHWTMVLTGGFCLMCIYIMNIVMKKFKFFIKCFFGMITITTVEFCVGCVVNRMLGWHVWDYSKFPLNILGQICLLYCAFWFILCIPANIICMQFQKIKIKLIGDLNVGSKKEKLQE